METRALCNLAEPRLGDRRPGARAGRRGHRRRPGTRACLLRGSEALRRGDGCHRRRGPAAPPGRTSAPEAEGSNLGLGHDIAAGLIDPTGDQLDALRQIVCHLLAGHYRELIAYGAGWTDRERQQPVGDTGRYEPRHVDAIVAAELQRALDEPDPLHGIAQLTARWGAAFVLNPEGVTRTKALGRERIARKLSDALPGGENVLRAAVWQFMRPMLSPNLAQLNRDAFVLDEALESTVRLEEHRGESDLAALDLGDETAA